MKLNDSTAVIYVRAMTGRVNLLGGATTPFDPPSALFFFFPAGKRVSCQGWHRAAGARAKVGSEAPLVINLPERNLQRLLCCRSSSKTLQLHISHHTEVFFLCARADKLTEREAHDSGAVVG